MENTKSKLKERFNMKDLGEISSFLGMDFNEPINALQCRSHVS